jgi:hypothetical protein
MEVNPKLMKSKDHIESKKKKKQKEKKEKHENVMKELPPSCFSCTTHPDDYLRMVPKQNKNPPTCKSCGFKLSGKLGYLTCPKSAGCFHLCSACKICSQNHMLRQVVSLKQYKTNPLYSENKYNCHGCLKDKAMDERGVWLCGPCNFSICPDCMNATDEQWESASLEEKGND